MADIWAQRGTELKQKIEVFLQNQKQPLPADLKQLCNEFWALCDQLIAADSDGGGFVAPSFMD